MIDQVMTEQEVRDESVQTVAENEAPQSAQAEELSKLKQEKQELFERLARLQAEFENYRKRSQKEQEDFRQYAVAEAVKAFLPILDNFHLALKHDTGSAEDLRKGVELIRKQMEDALARLGVQAIEAHGSEFDPHHHEAIEMIESNEHPDNHVVEQLQRGYKLRDRLLRPAMVRVAKNR
ncbi:MAG: nucleotide exchange factor GrpE [Acidobacteriales bacterium]|nr:nucleotide exchange factor GrpE [Terriglobales bacterium]